MSRVAPKTDNTALRKFIRDHETSVYCFCLLMLHKPEDAESAVLETFREFGDLHRKLSAKLPATELKIKLFQLAWQFISETDPEDQMRWYTGRDTRKANEWNKDLLSLWGKEKELSETVKSGLLNRVHLLNSEFKAPLILKDFLNFEDEEILRILGSRWGVYRHRLHRGRLDLINGLKGAAKESGVST